MNRISLNRIGWIAALAVVAALNGPKMALAHIGQGPAHDLSHGLENPFVVASCAVALVAVGIWAARRTGGAIWKAPLRLLASIFPRHGR